MAYSSDQVSVHVQHSRRVQEPLHAIKAGVKARQRGYMNHLKWKGAFNTHTCALVVRTVVGWYLLLSSSY